ncbi:MAG: hypothetical protein QOI61_180 [Actinomycetota bacterium]
MTWGLRPRQVANQLERCFRAETDLLRVLGGWTARVTENDERLAFARDMGFRAEHGEALRARMARLRTTDRMIHEPPAEWRQLIELIDNAPTTTALVAAVYDLVGAQLVDAYGALVADCDPLGDELTIRLVTRHLVPDHVERNAWAAEFLAGADTSADAEYFADVRAALDAAGGLHVRSDAVPADRTDDGAELGTGFWPLTRPAPELLFLGSEYRIAGDGEEVSYCPDYADFGQHDAEVLANHHGLMPEISSLAIVGSMVHEIHDRPWEFYRDFATQCSDEIRHIGLLLRRLEQLGADAGVHPFPTWNFYDAVAFLPLTERTLVFNAVVEGNVVETLHDRARAFRDAGVEDSAFVCDWISADESLHLFNGMRWLEASDTAGVDALLDRGQAILGVVMKQKGTSEKVFDSASESLSSGDFYAPRANPVAPIARELGGFTEEQIERLVASAKGKTIRS